MIHLIGQKRFQAVETSRVTPPIIYLGDHRVERFAHVLTHLDENCEPALGNLHLPPAHPHHLRIGLPPRRQNLQ
jgi:hypothetical protein